MINFSAYLQEPGHHRNPKNPLTLAWTLQYKQKRNGAHI